MSQLNTPRGMVAFVLFFSILIGLFMTGLYVRNRILTETEILSQFVSWFVIGVLIAIPVTGFSYITRSSLYRQPKPPKEIPSTIGKSLLEAEQFRLTKVCLEEIHNLHELTRINLSINEIKYIDLTPLARSRKLTELILHSNRLEEIDLSPLAECTNLEYLDLAANNLRNIDLRPIASCVKMTAINLGGNATGQIDLKPLELLKNLEILTIDDMKLTEVDLSPLENCSKLKFLKLNDNEMESLDITPLFDCKQLTEFEIDRIELTTTLDREIDDWQVGIQKHRRKIRICGSLV